METPSPGNSARSRPNARFVKAATASCLCFAATPSLAATPPATDSQAVYAAAGGHGQYRASAKPRTIAASAKYTVDGKTSTSSATSTVTRLPTPTATTVTSAMSTSALTQAEAYGIFTYSFEVIGPKSITVPVVITISGSLSQATKGGSLASVEIVPNQGYETGLQYGCGYGAPVKLCGAYSTSITVNVLSTKHANAAYANAVTLESDNQIYGGTATGSVTTSVAIAPGFTGGASYYIVQSPGVGNTATSTTSSRNP